MNQNLKIVDPEQVFTEYYNSLKALTTNSKILINGLTATAFEYSAASEAVANAIEGQLRKVSPNLKLPLIYLIDSIIKLHGESYIPTFIKKIKKLFLEAYESVDLQTKAKLDKVLSNWSFNKIFPDNLINDITYEISNPTSSRKSGPKVNLNNPNLVPVGEKRLSHDKNVFPDKKKPFRQHPPRSGFGQETPERNMQHSRTPTMRSQQPMRPNQSHQFQKRAGFRPNFPTQSHHNPPQPDGYQSYSARHSGPQQQYRPEPHSQGRPHQQSFNEHPRQFLPTIGRPPMFQEGPHSGFNHTHQPVHQEPSQFMPHTFAPPHHNQPGFYPDPYQAQMEFDPNQGHMEFDPNQGHMGFAPNQNHMEFAPQGHMEFAPNQGQVNFVPNQGQMNFAPNQGQMEFPINSGGNMQPQVPDNGSVDHNLLKSLLDSGVLSVNPPLASIQVSTSHLPIEVNSTLPHFDSSLISLTNIPAKPLVLSTLIVELTQKDINSHYEGAEDGLYKHQQLQCKQCGKRYPSSQENQEKLDVHMDWHFKMNRKRREKSKKPMSRTWYSDDSDWVSGQVTEFDYSCEPVFFNQISKPQNEIAEAIAKLEMAYIKVPIEHSGQPCPICKDKFTPTWSDEDEDWIYKNAVLVEDQVYHSTCYGDKSTSTKLSSNPSPTQVETTLNLDQKGSLSNFFNGNLAV